MPDRGKIIERLNLLSANRAFTEEWVQVFRGAVELLREQEEDTDWKAVAMTLAATLSEIRTDVCCDSRCGQGFHCMGHNEFGFAPTRCWIEWAKEKKLWRPEVSGDGTTD